ncbi:amino acid ABC transporter permease [Clostridium fungisolvens]|uniref:Putative glutamine ABC transporter permease protein GlnP n=1 Tax=Clostridium fungisolvens TaxID=1604897 RepID=A0A6V8SG40_9CLOT|nr:amino acid ABC transporter permease [Clostridium fungisolvens]GFP75676.1 putative glutamine ABC transporter permease protein GlnP [Clostridium fungisolvens]
MQNSVISAIFEGNNFLRLLGGLLVTARIAFISIIIGSVFGIVLGLLRTTKYKVIKFVLRLYLEIFRIIPTLVWLFILHFGVTAALDIQIDGEVVSIIVFSLWGAAEMSDIVRGALESLPKHQLESGKALGLTYIQLYRYILIPQAIRRLLPGAINLATRMVKTTSLVVLIGVVEVVKVGQQIIETARFTVPTASFWVYGIVFILYFIICYPLSLLSKRLEAKWNS